MADTFKGIVTADGKKRQLPYGSILDIPESDTSLTIAGGFADAAVVGGKIKKTDDDVASLKEDLVHLTEQSINLFDVSKLIRPGYYRGNDAVATENPLSEYCTDYVSVDSGVAYTWSALEGEGTFMICTYNEDKTIIERKTFQYTVKSVVFDSDVKYIRFSIINKFFTNEFMFVKGTELPSRYIKGGRGIPFVKGFDDNFAKSIKNIDLNDFTTNGTFSFGGNSNITNSPDNNGGFIINHYADTEYRRYQIFIPYNTNGKMYYRVKQGVQWTSWIEVGGPEINIVQTKGSNTSDVMSQKSVTDELLRVENLISNSEIADYSINLFNYNDLVDGYYKGDGIGYYTDGVSKRTENFIPVMGGQQYIWSKGNFGTVGVFNILINTYDVNQHPIERIITNQTDNRFNTMVFANNVAYVKLSCAKEILPIDFMFVKGSVLPEVFVPYGEYIKEKLIRPFEHLINNMNALWLGDSISMLRLLPHRVEQNLSIKVADCSIAGAPFVASATSDYQTLGVLSQIQSKTGDGTMSAQYTAIDNLATRLSWSDKDKVKRTENIDAIKNANMNEVNTVIILAGTNDHNSNISIDTFKTGIATAIETLLTAYPHIELYLISPTWRGDMTINSIGKTLEDYVEAEKEIAEAHQIPFYDLYHSCGINVQNQAYFLNEDRLHPSEKGDIMLAKKCARWLISN